MIPGHHHVNDQSKSKSSAFLTKSKCFTSSWFYYCCCLFLVTRSCVALSLRGPSYDYDLVIIGAGASGLFASGAATSLGLKTLLLDKTNAHVVGGDCSNAACVPSKAIRSVARLAQSHRAGSHLLSSLIEQQSAGQSYPNNISATSTTSTYTPTSTKQGHKWLTLARQHATNTVMELRSREDADEIADQNPNLDLEFVQECSFINNHEMQLSFWNESMTCSVPSRIKSKYFLLATGASPVVPNALEVQAKASGVPLYTYRSLLQPDDDPSIWELLKEPRSTIPNIVLVGGGATACELGQSLARLGGNEWNVTIVGPTLLPSEDATLQNSAIRLLTNDGITMLLDRRVEMLIDSKLQLSDGQQIPVDVVILCTGRSPESGLRDLNLDAAGVKWSANDGVHVTETSLRSSTAPNIYACGDCASVVSGANQRAAHGAWTGFHAARNMALPWILWAGSKSTHPYVPRVTYTDPELASIGLSHSDCIDRYGSNGFVSVFAPEQGMDRADMERLERQTFGFVELRATKIEGTILGMTACGPAAAELANEVGVALQNKLTVLDLARSMHSYPSHGYLLHRVALSMATSSVFGALDILGPVGRMLASIGKTLWRVRRAIALLSPINRKRTKRLRSWEHEGAQATVLTQDGGIITFFDIQSKTAHNANDLDAHVAARYEAWVNRRPTGKGR